MAENATVMVSDRGTTEKNIEEREEIVRLKKMVNLIRKYSRPIFFISLGMLFLQYFLNHFAKPASDFLSNYSLFGYALELKKLSPGLMDFIRGLFWISFLIWYGSHAVKIVQQFEKAVIRMFGKWRRTRKAGLCLMLYPLESIKFEGVFERKIDIVEQQVYSKDNILATANAVFWIRIRNIAAALFNVDNWRESVPALLETAIRNAVAQIEILKLNASRETITTSVKETFENKAGKSQTETQVQVQAKEKGSRKILLSLRKALTFYSQEEMEKEGWGIELRRAEIQEFKLPTDLEEQLRRVTVSERKIEENKNLKDARIQEATGLSKAKKLDYAAQIQGLKGLIEAAGGKEAYTMLKVAENLPDNTMIVDPRTLAGFPAMISKAIGLSKNKDIQPKDQVPAETGK